ncbi:hypothetical protein [Streptomyces sp. AcE210]|uniref:hypothetical protein n=1 Tax=Streptomyces sp. AcE210 TaxID=2292703 RepID=UPI001F0C406A|nr:hypothetical protein [Streptomyces sp. AcE210]
MGLRVVGLHLDNCGKRDYAVEGYPGWNSWTTTPPPSTASNSRGNGESGRACSPIRTSPPSTSAR